MSQFLIIAKKSGVDVYHDTRHGKRTILGSLTEWLEQISAGDCYYTEQRAKELVVLLEAHYKDSALITDISIQAIELVL